MPFAGPGFMRNIKKGISRHIKARRRIAVPMPVVKAYVRGAIRKEHEIKQATFSGAGGVISQTTGTYMYLCVPVIGGNLDEGVLVNQRIGNKIRLLSIEINFNVYLNNAQASALFRAVLLNDKDADGLPASTLEWLTANTAGQSISAPIREQGKSQYTVLSQRFANFTQPAGVVGLVPTAFHQFRIRKSWKAGKVVEFTNSATLGNTGDLQKNSIVLCLFSDALGLSTSSIIYSLRYTD